MNSYIKSEFYRILHYKGTYLFILICSAMLVSSNVLLAVVNLSEAGFRYANTSFSLGNFITSVSFIFVLCIAVASMIFGNEHVNHTMKNSISYGITRGALYFGKLIVEITYAVVAFIIITVFHVASAYLLLRHSNVNEINELLRASFVCLPLLLFALAATNCFVFILESAGTAVAATVGLLIAVPMIGSLLGMKFLFFKRISDCLPWNMINNVGLQNNPYVLILPWKDKLAYYNFWVYGLLQMIIITIVGYYAFKNKEIK